MLLVYRYIRKSIQQFVRSGYGVKFSVVVLSAVVIGVAGLGLISQRTHAIPLTSASTPVQKSASVQPDPQQQYQHQLQLQKRALTPDPKVTPTPVPTVVPTEVVPVPTQAPAAPAPVSSAANGDVAGMINQVFGSYAGAAMNVARCESGLNPAATNPSSGAAGVFQIMPATFNSTSEAGSSPYNAYANVAAAHDIFVRDGYSWREWVCQP